MSKSGAALFISFSLLVFAAKADEVLILSGGGSPRGNHYSQYLQTKTLTDGLRAVLPGTQVTVYFGAGNAVGQSPVLADVHRSMKTDKGSREVMVSGSILGNQAATRENVDAYFTSGQTSLMNPDETFFVIVSDHGMPFQKADGSFDLTYSNNCIDLWGFQADLANNTFSSGTPAERCFSKDQLKTKLHENVAAGRTVFAMSQCYSGGFHRMSVDLSGAVPTANPLVCGFTAITEDTTASGCTPDVDGPGYQGYERSFTEQLTGVDVVSGQRLRPARKSFIAAHRAAAIEDLAKDIPLATSDFFLWKWALTIGREDFVPRTAVVGAAEARQAVSAVKIGQRDVRDADYASKEAFFLRMQRRLTRMYPEYTELTGDLAQHIQLEARLADQLAKTEEFSSAAYDELSKNEAELLKQWGGYVRAGKSALSPIEAELETDFFAFYDGKYGPGAGGGFSLYVMSLATITDPAKAAALGEYKAMRVQYAIEWALGSRHPRLVNLAKRLQAQNEETTNLDNYSVAIQKRHGHVRRLLIYRQVLGAWSALARMQDTSALTELKGLITCEATKLPM